MKTKQELFFPLSFMEIGSSFDIQFLFNQITVEKITTEPFKRNLMTPLPKPLHAPAPKHSRREVFLTSAFPPGIPPTTITPPSPP